MAQRFLQANYRVVVWNRTPDQVKPLLDQGASDASTPKEAAEQVDIVISMVADDEASRQIWLDADTGVVRGLTQDVIALDFS